MGKPIINGAPQPVRQPMTVSYDPQRGLQIRIPWESAGDNLRGLAAAYQQSRVAYELEATPLKSRLVATASGGQLGIPDLTTDTWQIMGNEIQKTGFEHPLSLGLSDDQIADLQQLANNHTKPSDITPALTGDVLRLYKLLLKDSSHYALGQYVLRHTTNVSNQYNSNISDFNIERIYTTSQLIAETTNSNSWTFPLPGRMVFKLQNLTAPTAQTDYLWGWRKLPSTEATTAGNRVEITTEYWLEQWSLYYYQTAA